jgi:hypothetical protein
VDEMDALVELVRTDGPMSLPLDGWDQASIWGWDETTGSLYAHLWRNTDDPIKPPTIRIAPDDLTPVITCPVTLTQHIAMAVDRDPWEVVAAVAVIDYEDDGDQDWGKEEAGTVVTMTEGYGIWWPPNFSS